MASPIHPISELPAARIEEYLVRRGLSADVVHWKFYDEAINRGRERGYAWFEDDRVQGFMGLMPAQLGRDGLRVPMEWTVDWSIENPRATPGRGVKIFQHTIAHCDQLMFASRGSEDMWSYAPRLAERTIPDAGRIFLRPLRVGYALDWLGRRATFLQPSLWPRLAALPFPGAGRSRGDLPVRSEPGISRALAPLFEAPRGPGWYPHYDPAYVEWVIGRCPLLDCGSVWVPADDGPVAGAVLWRLRSSSFLWRLALWARPDSPDALRAVLAEAAHQARRQGGSLLAVMVSHLDNDFTAALRAERWLATRGSSPLLVITRKRHAVDDLSRLSYLDVDLAHQMGGAR